MESIRNVYLSIIIVLGTFIGNAQEVESNSSSLLAKNLDKETVLDQKNSSDDAKYKNSHLKANIVNITQIGYSNYADLNIRSSNSKMAVYQDGTNNYLEVYKSGKDLNQSFEQLGNNNFISDFSSYSSTPVNMSLNQDGNNLSLYSSGSNSISKDLKINQTGNSGMIFIYNNR